MDGYKDTNKKLKIFEITIIILGGTIALSMIILQFSDKCVSNYGDQTLEKSLDMNVKLLDSFRFQLAAFNSEYNSLTGVCYSKFNQSIIYDNENEMNDNESVIYGMYKLGSINCEEFLNMMRHYYISSHRYRLDEVILLNNEITQRKQNEPLCFFISDMLKITLLVLTLGLIILNLLRYKSEREKID